ncbi:MAG: quinohemoprotein amine dehydrogenase subunit beta [Colwellia sp.]
MNRNFYQTLFLSSLVMLVSACQNTNISTSTEDKITTNMVNVSEKEFLITVTRPDTTVHIIDLQKNEVIRQCDLPAGPGPGTLVMSPDNSIVYILTDHFSDIYGVNIDNCDVVFSTQQSTGNIRVKSIASIAISPDGKEIYTHQNRVRKMNDHFEMLPPQIAVFNTSAGLKVKASRTYDAPRQIATMDTLESGELVMGGQDIFLMDIHSGKYNVILPSLNDKQPGYSAKDVLTVWQMGKINNEFYRMYSRAKFNGDEGDLANAEYIWGHETVNLKTGKAEAKDFGPVETVLFTSIRRPGQLNRVYGTLNDLKEYDSVTQKLIRSIDLPHTYYCINFSHDGSKIYLSGAVDKIAVYDADTFENLAHIKLTGDGSMSTSIIFKRQG